jgi:hypothetical protein
VCLLCYGLTGDEHWTDARPGSEPQASVRARRRRLLAAVMRAHGLDYSDDPSGVTAIVSDRKGSARVVRGLGEVWAAAEDLAHAPLDPLDPALLERLGADAA